MKFIRVRAFDSFDKNDLDSNSTSSSNLVGFPYRF